MKIYYWISKKQGIISSSNEKCPVDKIKNKATYMGYSEDKEFPIKLSTGRLLHKDKKNKRLDYDKKIQSELKSGGNIKKGITRF